MSTKNDTRCCYTDVYANETNIGLYTTVPTPSRTMCGIKNKRRYVRRKICFRSTFSFFFFFRNAPRKPFFAYVRNRTNKISKYLISFSVYLLALWNKEKILGTPSALPYYESV